MKFSQPLRSPVKVISGIQAVVKGAVQTFLRFPLAILLAITGAAFCVRELHLTYNGHDLYFGYINLIASAYLGMLLSIALTVRAEKQAFGVGTKVSLQLAVVVFAALFYFTLPDHFLQKVAIRFVLYALGLHWLIACIAFSGRENNGFWLFNKKLFLNILTSALYTAVLYIGIALALRAIDQLFKVDLDPRLYPEIWFVLVGVFNTWFFLSNFPAEYENPAAVTDYPKGLKIFTQFVLLPILTIYLLILYAYLFRIIFTATWPYGWVSYLVLGFSVAGILAILLVWPLREEESNKWISGYSRFFYMALFPLIILLFIAIWKRVAAYGITELRYFVLLLAMWLLVMAVYFLFSKRKSIWLIPLSLCVTAFLVSFGPWGAAGVSLYSQQHRLKALLVKDKILVDGKINGKGDPLPLQDRKEISDITMYIVEMHDYRVLQPWFRENLDDLMKHASTDGAYYNHRMTIFDQSEVLIRAMKVKPAFGWSRADDTSATIGFGDNEHFSARLKDMSHAVAPVKGYEYLVPTISANFYEVSEANFQIRGTAFVYRLDSAANRLIFSYTNDSALVVDLSPVVKVSGFEQNVRTYDLPAEVMTLDTENSQWASRLFLEYVGGELRDGKKHITSAKGYFLLRKK